MKLKAGQIMHLDILIRKLEKDLQKSKKIFLNSKERNKTQTTFRDSQRAKIWDVSGKDVFNSLKAKIDILRNEAKVFLVDEMTLDSLYNVQHGNLNYEKSLRLPFPFIFFEFAHPLMVQTIGKKKNLTGMLYSALADFTNREGFKWNIESPKPQMLINLVFKGEEKFFGMDSITYNILRLPEFLYSSREFGAYNYTKERGLEKLNLMPVGNIAHAFFDPTHETPETREFPKIIDLSLNLINYINAQNVVIHKVSRRGNLYRTDRERKKKRKNEIPPPKSYYWVEIKKSYIREEEDEGGEKAWELEYRVWVRGHFRHYQDEKCIWLEPFIKGPENAPWKHNRYAVLYKNFRHLLKNRSNENL